MNPYNGQILANESDFRTPFSRALWTFHASFLLGEAGAWLVGTATAILLLSLLSGAFLVAYSISKGGWQVLSVRWKDNGRIVNRRLHNLASFVFLPVLCAIAFTGCLMAFKPVEDLSMRLIGAPARMSNFPSSRIPADGAPVSVDEVLRAAAVFQGGTSFERAQLYFPSAPDDSFRVQINAAGERRDRELLFFDQYSGERLADPYATEREEAESIYWSFRGFHYGTYFGPPMEVAWFLGCLSLLVLVTSGLFIWLAHRRKRTRTVPKPVLVKGYSTSID